jgi:hypothetical protein
MFGRRIRRPLFLIMALIGAFVVGGYTCSAPVRSAAHAQTAPTGHWMGYWTWDPVNWRWYWTWVWVWDTGGWKTS